MAKKITAAITSQLRPAPRFTIIGRADAYRKLSAESSAEPGIRKTDTAPYQREIMDTVSDSRIEIIVIMSSAQVGKTEIINNIVGYYIHQDPAPIPVVQPTEKMAESRSTDRLSPMIRDTEALRELVKDPRSRDSGNKILYKQFPGGHITIAGSNSPSSLASAPLGLCFAMR